MRPAQGPETAPPLASLQSHQARAAISPHISSPTRNIAIPIVITPAGKPIVDNLSNQALALGSCTKGDDVASVTVLNEIDGSPGASTPDQAPPTPNYRSSSARGSCDNLPDALLGLNQTDHDGVATLAGTDDGELLSLELEKNPPQHTGHDLTLSHTLTQRLAPVDQVAILRGAILEQGEIPRSADILVQPSVVITDRGDRIYGSRRRDTNWSNQSESSAGSATIPTSLRCQLHNALVKPRYRKVETQSFLPKFQLDELMKQDLIAEELLKSEKSIRRRLRKASRLEFRTPVTNHIETATKICGTQHGGLNNPDNEVPTYKKILAIILLCGEKKERIHAFIDEKVCDSVLPLAFCSTRSKRFDLCAQKRPGIRLECFKTWGREDRRRFLSRQWAVLSPYFARDENTPNTIPHYKLPNDIILPFLTSVELGRRGAYGVVQKVAIHAEHHDFGEFAGKYAEPDMASGEENKKALKAAGYFAVKSLDYPSLPRDTRDTSYEKLKLIRKRVDKEVGILKAVNKKPHHHLITLLVTYSHQDYFHLVFPPARCDLLRHWQAGNRDQAHSDELTARWLAQQCHGLASGLKQVHQSSRVSSDGFAEKEQLVRRSVFSVVPEAHALQDPEPRRIVCQHGDLKPPNILLFEDSPSYQSVGSKGVLKIADFGVAEFGEYGAIARKPLPTTPIYQAPEAALGELSMGNAYDIWSLGCVFLEFAIWCFGGWTYVESFDVAREEVDPVYPRPRVYSTTFFRMKGNRSTDEAMAEVKDSIYQYMKDMHKKPECTRFFHDFLDLIQREMLVVDPKKRITSADLERKLDELKSRDRFDPGYFREHSGR